jgi:carboxypeptidase T
MYGEQTSKPATFAYTPEVGGSDDGFWPLQQRILPLIRENMLASITAARLAGLYGTIADVSPLFLYEQSGYLPFEIKRLGMQNGSFTVSVLPLGNAFASIGDAKVIQGMTLLEKRNDSISFQLNNTLHVGDTIQYVLAVNNGYFSEYDTVMRIFGYPVTVLNDDLTTKSNWTGNWNITTLQYFSPPSSMTDSPSGNYPPNSDKSITLINEIELPTTLLMVLQFRAKWALEKAYDYVQVSISDNNGLSWTPLQGEYTHPGTVNQAYGQPVYDGNQSEWVREAISLNAYMGKKVKFRFRIKTDAGTQTDGFYFDDFNISMVLDPTPASKNLKRPDILGIPYPNPASACFEVSYDMPQPGSNAHLIVSNIAGTYMSTTRLEHQKGIASIDISKLAAGMYFIRLVSGDFQSEVRKLIVK